MTFKERIKQINSYIPALYLSLKSKQTPFVAKLLAFLTIGYALSPIDLIPDFIPVLGLLDDLVLLPILITLTIKFIPKEVFNAFLEESQTLKLTKHWYYALPIIVFYIIIIIIVVKQIFF